METPEAGGALVRFIHALYAGISRQGSTIIPLEFALEYKWQRLRRVQYQILT